MGRLRYAAQRSERIIRGVARRVKQAAPILLDVAGYVAVTVGVSIIWGPGWAWLTAGGLLVAAGIRAGSGPGS